MMKVCYYPPQPTTNAQYTCHRATQHRRSQTPLESLDTTRSSKPNQAVAQEQSTLVDGAEQRQTDRRTSGCAARNGPPREAAVAEADVHLRAAQQLIQIHHIIGKQNRSTSAQRRGESEQITKFTAASGRLSKTNAPRRWGCRGCRRSASPSPT